MIFYVKKRSDFETIAILETEDYSCVIESDVGAVSRAVFRKDDFSGKLGDFLIMNENKWMGIITSIDKDGDNFNIACSDILSIFSRPIQYNANLETDTTEAFISSMINADFISIDDHVHAMPYIDLALSVMSPFLKPDLSDNSFFRLDEYIRQARRIRSVFVDFFALQNRLLVVIAYRASMSYNVDLDNDSTYILERSDFTGSSVAKISAVYQNSVTSYYLLKNGLITTNPGSEQREDGCWKVIEISDAEKEEDTVVNEFSKNSTAHSIKFLSPEIMDVESKLNIRFNEAFLISKVTQVEDIGGEIYRITCGTSTNTLTDKIKEIQTFSGTSFSRFTYPIGSIITTSTNVNPEAIYGGTWELIYKKCFLNNRAPGDASDTYFLRNKESTALGQYTLFAAQIIDNILKIYLVFQTAMQFLNTDLSVGYILWDSLGVSTPDAPYPLTYPHYAYNQHLGYNAFGISVVYPSGHLVFGEAINSYGGGIPAGTWQELTADIPIPWYCIHDDICNEWKWKRIA